MQSIQSHVTAEFPNYVPLTSISVTVQIKKLPRFLKFLFRYNSFISTQTKSFFNIFSLFSSMPSGWGVKVCKDRKNVLMG